MPLPSRGREFIHMAKLKTAVDKVKYLDGGFFTLVFTFFKLFFIHVLWIRNFVVCLHHRNEAIPKHHTIMTYGVYYVATREAKTFAGMQDELIATFNNFNDAVDMANSETYLDEMHDGYVVRNI